MILLIFDCDGVLVDSEPIANQVLAEMLTFLGRPMTTEEAIRTTVGRSDADIFRETAAITGRPIPPEIEMTAQARLFDLYRAELHAIDGIEAALAALPQRRCLASSSRPERIDLALDVTGLGRFFAHRFSAVQVARGKPAPDLFLLAAREMDFAPAQAIVIEDSVAGVTAARAADMRAIGFTGGGHADAGLADRLSRAGAQVIVSHMRDLPDAVATMQGAVPSPL